MQEIFKKSLNQSCRYLQGCSQGGGSQTKNGSPKCLPECTCTVQKGPRKGQGRNYHEASEAIVSSLRIIQFSAIILS